MENIIFLLAVVSCTMLFLCIGCIIGDGLECFLKNRKKKRQSLKGFRTLGTSRVTSDFRAGYVTPPPLSLLTIERSTLAQVSPEKESGVAPLVTGATTFSTVEHQPMSGSLCDEFMQSKRYATRRN